MQKWSDITKEFEADGSLRDIYISPTNEAIWDEFIELIANSSYKTEFFHNDKSISFPIAFCRIKELQFSNPTILHIWIGSKIQVNCHFFTEEEIELDISPLDVPDEQSYTMLQEFMFWLSSSLRLSVKLTHEGSPDMLICEVFNNGI